MTSYYLGFDIGGTKCSVVLGTGEGRIIDKHSFATAVEQGPEHAIEKLLSSAKDLLKKHTVSPRAIGIACGSPLDPEQGVIQSPPNLPTWKDIPICHIANKAFGVPAYLDNDANAGALAELSFGAGKGFKNVIFITFGTGCGSGLILDGRIYRGTNCYAGEIGHLRLSDTGPLGYHKKGSFEGYCSGGGLPQIAQSLKVGGFAESALPEDPTAADIGRAAAKGDKLALEVLRISGEYLGKGLALLVDVLNPERIIIGSIFIRCEEYLRPAMQKALEEEALPQAVEVCEIVGAGLGESIGDFAALSVAYYFEELQRTIS